MHVRYATGRLPRGAPSGMLRRARAIPARDTLRQTGATRAEPGNVFFEWSRSVDRPNQFVLLEAFRDRAAGEAHVHSEHFQAAMAWMPEAISETPEIIHVEAPGESWSTMAELQPRTT